jgi:L-iditol 2-dehydrogenase
MVKKGLRLLETKAFSFSEVTMMKAAVLERPGKLEIRELPDPSCPTGGVVVKILTSHVCSTDLHMWEKGHPALRYPRILGHEIAGVVAEASNDGKRFKVGDKVQVYPGISCGSCKYCRGGRENLCPSMRILGFSLDGGFAQYLALPKDAVENGCLNVIPSALSLSEAAMAEPLACCLNGLEKVELKKDETVVILGAGPIGCLCAMASNHLGAGKVILVEQDPSRRTLSQRASADTVLDSTEVDVVEAVKGLTNGRGAQVVVTCFREAPLVYPLLELAAPGGRVLMFSGISGNRGVVPTDLNVIHYRELALIGAYGCTTAQCQRALDLFAEGLEVDWLISQRVDLNGLEESFSALSSREAMKICVEPWEGNHG